MRRASLALLLLFFWTAAWLPLAPSGAGFITRFHPDGPLYAGDLVSLEILAPSGFQGRDSRVEVRFEDQLLAEAAFGRSGITGRLQARFLWVWDTRSLQPGIHTLTFTIQPGGQTWQETVALRSPDALPPPEPGAAWAAAESACCRIHYITGTAAARDLDALLQMADEEAAEVARLMQTDLDEKITITLLPRTLGHGGFAGKELYVSYLDRNYAGSTTRHVLRHEMVHWMDNRLGGEYRPPILVEGLAVYLSGGHFKPEPLLSRAAALLDLDWYIPLAVLADSFYPQQHEVGYLQAGALVAYLVEAYGWEHFEAFYRGILPHPSGSPFRAIDQAARSHFDLPLARLEANFLAYLRTREVSEQVRTDLRLSVAFYETVRRYQGLLDPSAYFLTAWLPDGEEMRRRGIVADYLRRPRGLANFLAETLLVRADRALRLGRYPECERSLALVNFLLDAVQAGKGVRPAGQSLQAAPMLESFMVNAPGGIPAAAGLLILQV
jgi:hypothetical protein